jgi:enterochelin esterase-like enzyme
MKNIVAFTIIAILLTGILIFPISHLAADQSISAPSAATVTATAQATRVQATATPTAKPVTKSTAKPTFMPHANTKATTVAVLPEGPSAAVLPSPTPALEPTAVKTEATQPDLPVTLDTLAIFSKNMDGAERVAQIYLPGDYLQNPDKRYPVLYALDGQQLPEIGFEQTLNDLNASGAMTPVIVVAIYSTEGDLRREELGAGTNINLFGWGSLSDAFNRFMVDELLPQVNSKYRTLTGPKNTAIMGWSLGGLTSFYLAWQYPDTFGTVGAFSPSFWWRTASQPGEELQTRVIPNLVAAGDKRPGLRMWFEAGTKELPYSDVDHNGVIDMIQDVQDVMKLLAQKGYQANTDMVYVEVPGGQHELSTWETVLPNFLHFAFPVQ